MVAILMLPCCPRRIADGFVTRNCNRHFVWGRVLVAAKHGVVREPLEGSTGAGFFARSFRNRICAEPDLAIWLNAGPRKCAVLLNNYRRRICQNFRLGRAPRFYWVC